MLLARVQAERCRAAKNADRIFKVEARGKSGVFVRAIGIEVGVTNSFRVDHSPGIIKILTGIGKVFKNGL